MKMNICLIGGIYGQGSGYLRVTPETTLEAGLRAAGHQVTTLSHYAAVGFDSFDVVHVHHLSFGAARLAADRSSTPFVFTPHDASRMSGASLGLARNAAMNYVLSRADTVVCLSEAERMFLASANGVPAERLATIPNGIDSSVFACVRRNSAGRNSASWKLLFVGQLIPLKGCDLILRAMADLVRAGRNVELSLAYQTADLEPCLRALAAELGIAARVHFLGRRTPRELAALYAESDLLVLASETEALPSVITESMLCGLPFVATAVGGVPEQSGGFGYLVRERNQQQLAAGIAHVLDRYSTVAATAQPMSERARRLYSRESMLEKHLAVYRSLAGASRTPRRHALLRRPANAAVRWAVGRWGNSPMATPAASPTAAIVEEKSS